MNKLSHLTNAAAYVYTEASNIAILCKETRYANPKGMWFKLCNMNC